MFCYSTILPQPEADLVGIGVINHPPKCWETNDFREESSQLEVLSSLVHLFTVFLATTLLILQAGSWPLRKDRTPSLANIYAVSLPSTPQCSLINQSQHHGVPQYEPVKSASAFPYQL